MSTEVLARAADADRVATLVDEIVGQASAPDERRSAWLQRTGFSHADARMRAWLRSVGRDAAGGERLLASRGLDPIAFKTSLDEHRPVAGQPRPAWARMIADMAEAATRGAASPYVETITIGDVAGAMGPPGGVDPDLAWPWLPLMAPFLRLAEEGLSIKLDGQTPGLARDLRLALVRRLNGVSVRVLIAPLSAEDVIAAAPSALGPNLLASCLHPAGPPGWLGVWRAYPVLARLQAVTILNWRHACEHLLTALAEDRPRLEATFGADLGPALGASFDQGDTHDGGQAVSIVRFAARKLAWKPRDVGPAQLWAGVLERINPHLAHPLRSAATVVGPNRAWQEFVPESAPADEAEIAAYFWRIGATARLLQALGSVDFHGENLIAAGAHPVLIDLETLLAPIPKPGPSTAAERAAAQRLRDMPERSGLITVRADGKSGRRGIEVGGIAPRKPQQSPSPALQLRVAADGVYFDPGFHRIRTGTAMPPLEDSEAVLAAHFPTIEQGYQAADEALATLGSDWLPSGADDVMTRHVVRPTRIYARLIGASQEPACLRDGALRELALERLWSGDFDVPPAAIDFEQACMRDLDIPTYQARAGSTDLYYGAARSKGYFSEPALPGPPGPVADAGPLRAVLFARQPEQRGLAPAEAIWPRASLASDLRDALRALADLLAGGAIDTGDDLAWISLQWDPRSDGWMLGQVDDSAFNGRAGLAHALDLAGGVLEDPALTRLAARIRQAAADRLRARLRVHGTMPLDLGETLSLFAGAEATALFGAAEYWLASLSPEIAAEHAAELALALHAKSGAAALLAEARRILATAASVDDAGVLDSIWSAPLAGARFMDLLAAGSSELPDSGRLGDALALTRGSSDRSGEVETRLRRWIVAPRTLAEARDALEAALVLGEAPAVQRHAAILLASHRRDGRWFPDVHAPDTLFLGNGFGVARLIRLLAKAVALA